jgi:O-antigen/teichoic acid export membrane protein
MVGSLLFTLLAWKFGHGNLIVYAWSWVIGLVLGILYSLFSFYKNYYIPYLSPVKAILDKPFLKQIVTYAFWVLVAANIGTILGQIDMQFIIYFL